MVMEGGPMGTFLIQLLLGIRSRFTRRVLEAENLILRKQLAILRRKSPSRVRLWNIDRLLIVLLYRLNPSLLDAIIIVQPGRLRSAAQMRVSRLSVLEVPWEKKSLLSPRLIESLRCAATDLNSLLAGTHVRLPLRWPKCYKFAAGYRRSIWGVRGSCLPQGVVKWFRRGCPRGRP